MINKLEKEIIFRFLKSRKKDSFLNLISIFSFIGITLGVSVLIIVMSVMNGFRTELINKIVGFNAHAVVKSYDKKLNIDFETTKNISEEVDNIILSNDGEAVIINKNSTKGVLLKGFLSQDFTKLNVLQNKNASSTPDGRSGLPKNKGPLFPETQRRTALSIPVGCSGLPKNEGPYSRKKMP